MHRALKPVIKQPFNLFVSPEKTKQGSFVPGIVSLPGFCRSFVLSFSLTGRQGNESRECREPLGWAPPKDLHFNPFYLCRREHGNFLRLHNALFCRMFCRTIRTQSLSRPSGASLCAKGKRGKKLPVPPGNLLGDPLPSRQVLVVFLSGWMGHCCLCNKAMGLPAGIKK